MKYPFLCAVLATCSVAIFVTGGNLLVVSATVTLGKIVVQSVLQL